MANIIDSYSESNQNTVVDLYATVPAEGQSFTGNGATLGSAVFYLKKTGSSTGNAVAKIYAHSGTFGTSSVPTGAALATSDNFDVSTLTTSLQLITFTFSGANQIVLDSGTKYVVTAEYSGGNGSNKVDYGNDSSSPTHGGNRVFFFSGAWNSSTGDSIFYVYDNAGDNPAPSVSENITVTESLASYSDTIFIRESVQVQFGAGTDLSINVSDSITITESTKLEPLSFINTSESITITESINRIVESYVNKSESITVSENVQMGFPGPINVNDTITVSENASLLIQTNFPQPIVSDSITITENVSVAISSPQVNVSDTVTITENSKSELTSFINKSESITVTESTGVSITAPATLSINTNDIITITESTNETIVTPSVGGRNTRLMMGVGL